MINTRKFQKGSTLVEVMSAILILVIVVIGTSSLFAYGRGQIDVRKHYRAAVQLACQELEGLKGGNYFDIAPGEKQETISLEGITYTRSIKAVDNGANKNVTVTVLWKQMNKEQNVSLTTVIAPK